MSDQRVFGGCYQSTALIKTFSRKAEPSTASSRRENRLRAAIRRLGYTKNASAKK